jgi:hypothetical protein
MFKSVRKGLKVWNKELSKLKKLINNNFVLAMLDGLEKHKPEISGSSLSLISSHLFVESKKDLLETMVHYQMGKVW